MMPVITELRTSTVQVAAVNSEVVTDGDCQCAAAATASVAEGCDTQKCAFL